LTSRVLAAKSKDRIFTLGFILVGLATLAQASSLLMVVSCVAFILST